jgi:hypothetical protein
MRASYTFLSAIFLVGCSNTGSDSESGTTTTVGPTTAPPPVVKFPSVYMPIIDSSLFVKPLLPFWLKPIDEFVVEHSTEVIVNASKAWTTLPDYSMAGMHATSFYYGVVKAYDVYLLSKLTDPIYQGQNSVQLDYATVLTANQTTLSQSVPLLQDSWGGYASYSLNAYTDEGVTNVVDAIKHRLEPNDEIVGLRVMSMKGNQVVQSFEPSMYFAQTTQNGTVSV